MLCLRMQMNESGQDRKSINQYVTARSSSSSRVAFRFPESLLDGINHELSPTPIDPNRISIVDDLPLQSFRMCHDEASSEMLISLLMGSLPDESQDSCASKYIQPEPSWSESGKVEHVISTSQAMSHRNHALRPAALKKAPSSEKKYTPPSKLKRPHGDVSSCGVASPEVPSSTESKPAIASKKKRNRALNTDQWYEKLNELREYKNTFGHCHVPHNWKQNIALAQWVKRQRYQVRCNERTVDLLTVVHHTNVRTRRPSNRLPWVKPS